MTAHRLTFSPSGCDLADAKASARRTYNRARKMGSLAPVVIDKFFGRDARGVGRTRGGDVGRDDEAHGAIVRAAARPRDIGAGLEDRCRSQARWHDVSTSAN